MDPIYREQVYEKTFLPTSKPEDVEGILFEPPSPETAPPFRETPPEGAAVTAEKLYDCELFRMKELLNGGGEGVREAYIAKRNELYQELKSKLLEKMQSNPSPSDSRALNSSLLAPLQTNSSLSALRTKILFYSATVSRKEELLKELHSLEKPHLSLKERWRVFELKSQLRSAPTDSELQTIKSALEGELGTPFRLLGKREAKEAAKLPPALKWGEPHLPKTLQNPLLWIPTRTLLIKETPDGHLLLSDTLLEPIDVEKGGRPAIARRDDALTKKPMNLWKTTHTLRESDGKALFTGESFRGGYFATPSAAKDALQQMGTGPIHINSLLTPSSLAVVRDRKLLNTHGRNIQEASQGADVVTSNFGVNKGAVGSMKALWKRLRLGWHASIGRFSNKAAVQLNEELGKTVERAEKLNAEAIDRAALLLPLCLEMEEIWATNSFADAKKMEGQFRMPALWKAVDQLIGIQTFTNCWSGKDRTSAVEATAEEILDEALFRLRDKKVKLEERHREIGNSLQGDALSFWNKNRALLTSGVMNIDDLNTFAGKSDQKSLEELIRYRLRSIKSALGGDRGLLEKKSVPNSRFLPDTLGISLNEPKRGRFEAQLAMEMIGGKKPEAADLQRQAVQRRAAFLSSGPEVTLLNTGRAGLKLDKTEISARSLSGFDRAFILEKLDTNPSAQQIKNWLGLEELGKETAESYARQLLFAKGSEKDLKKLLSQIERAKMALLTPQKAVSA